MFRLWFLVLVGLAGLSWASLARAQGESADMVPVIADSAAQDEALAAPMDEEKGESSAEPEPVPEPEVDVAINAVAEAADVEAAPEAVGPAVTRAATDGPALVWVIPVRDAIGRPILYVLRRGLKEAQAAGASAVIIDMDTPGGELGTTLQIMEALDKFDGQTLVYVNKEAISAGAINSAVTDEIHFAPGAVIGAAAAVSGGGADIPETMKQKINSYLNAKVRSFSAGKGYRAEVIRAMMDADFEFKIGEEVIKPEGELLSLTAEEAEKTYGDPPRMLLSSGTHKTLEDLLVSKYGEGGYTLTKLEVSWSEELAAWLSRISPLLMGLGLLCVFVEFKTPGFGVFGVVGGVLLAVVFFGHYSAGLSGHEAALVFVVGLVLVAVELFLISGTLIAGLTGAALMLGALVWSMIDVWPGELPAFDGDTLFTPFLNLGIAMAVAVVGALALARFIPRGWFWDKMILGAAVTGDAVASESGMGGDGWHESAAPEGGDGLLGAYGRTVSAMRPMGEVEIGGRRYEARAADGALERGQAVRVVERAGRTLIVEADVT